MKSDHFAMPTPAFTPPAAKVPYHMTKFTAHCIGWGLVALAGAAAIIAVVIMAESVLSP